jgi:hypothetical protein
MKVNDIGSQHTDYNSYSIINSFEIFAMIFEQLLFGIMFISKMQDVFRIYLVATLAMADSSSWNSLLEQFRCSFCRVEPKAQN